MKGILFSSDFVVDGNGNERLLEINTDTAFLNSALPLIDFSEFFSVLNTNNITKVDVVYKDEIHRNFVDHLSSSIVSDAPFITTFNKTIIAENNIFPTIPVEDSDTFLLRLAYDESAILDSEYAKGTMDLLKLFVDSGDTGSVCNFYHSSSLDGYYNTLDGSINNSIKIPDFVVKTTFERRKQGVFYKLGKPELSNEDRLNEFFATVLDDGSMIQQYHFNQDNVNANNKITSIRSYKIVYGSNLDIISLVDYNIEAIFDLPADLSVEVDSTKIDNLLSTKHYYEFATNFAKQPQKTKGGLLDTHEVLMEDGTEKQMQNLVLGDRVVSYFISGSPMRDNPIEVFGWSYSGSMLPSGSFLTASYVQNIFTSSIDNNLINEIKIGADVIYPSVSNTFLVYQTDTDSMVYKKSIKIDPSKDLLINNTGNSVVINENNLFVLDEDIHKVIEIDVEDVDTYLLAGSENLLNTTFIITHNYCFPAGTKITMDNGELKNIEDVLIGDKILTYNEKSKLNEIGVVGNLKQHQENSLIKLKFDSIEITTTNEHPFYILNKGWIKASELSIGDFCLTIDGNKLELNSIQSINQESLVYNLLSVSPNHNFYANNILVHNK